MTPCCTRRAGGASPVEEGGRVHRAGSVGARRVEQTGRGIAIEPRELVLVAETAAAGAHERGLRIAASRLGGPDPRCHQPQGPAGTGVDELIELARVRIDNGGPGTGP